MRPDGVCQISTPGSGEEYQAELIERLLRVAGQRPFVAGTHVWRFADFATA